MVCASCVNGYTAPVSYLLALLGLGILILVHEMGHMLVARAFGMRVDKFSIFFGPALFRWRGKNTVYQLCTVPLGGYVQIAGMNPHEDIPEDDPGSYQNKSRFAQFATVVAGPLVNYLFAIVILVLVMLAWGAPRPQIAIDRVLEKSPAAVGGVKAGDRLMAINGKKIRGTEHMLAMITASGGKPLTIKVQRDSGQSVLTVKPKPQGSSYKIGVSFRLAVTFQEISAGAALSAAVAYPWRESKKIVTGLGRLVSGKAKTDQVGGPVEIVRQLKTSFDTSIANALLFLAMLNVYLGLFNLLPLPALDGGRLVFITISAVMRKKFNRRVENMVHTVGFLVLIGLLLLVTYGDIRRLFG